jgi:DeoR/GlpR family transcriptional regulator of sugar metabolism
MPEAVEARRMRLLEVLTHRQEPQDLDDLAIEMQCDARTIRRDVDHIQQLLTSINGIELKRGRVFASRNAYSYGYFADQLDKRTAAKQTIARKVVKLLKDDMPIALTAGSTPYEVAREIRRTVVEGEPPHNLIVFTNSIPSLLELVAVGVSCGVLGEIYSSEDCALHTSEFRSAFLPGIAIVGASGILAGTGPGPGLLDLFSHRAEEAAFLMQVLNTVPEVIVAADSSKIGKRHPWNFGGATLHGKKVRLVTEALSDEQRSEMLLLKEKLMEFNTDFTFETA